MIPRKDTVQMYNLPVEVKFCKRCTISNQRPRITFDEEGVCSACRFAEYKKTAVDWKVREKELRDLCDRFRRDDGSWDVIVPSSGGKDSASVAHKLKYKYGMNPLTVTWAPHLYTDIGWKNFQAAIHVGNVDNILATPGGKIHRKLTALAFEILGDPFQPFIYGQTNFPLQTAVRLKIPLLMYGENGEVEYGGDMKNAFKPTRDYGQDHKVHYFSGLAPEDLVHYGVAQRDLVPYMAPPVEALKDNGTEIHFFSYYEKWIPQENYYYCVENTGFNANPDRSEGTYSKYASLDDKLDGYHYYLAYVKFGLGRATSDSAHEIRDGHITREEGVGLVRRFDGEFPKKYFHEFLEYCDITEEYFQEVIDSWRSPHLWERVDGEWKLRYQVE
jgi:N-acetyl sugar amidotransferase